MYYSLFPEVFQLRQFDFQSSLWHSLLILNMAESNTQNYKQFFDIDRIMSDIAVYLPNFDKKRFKEAFDYAEKAHCGQLRKDGKTPYIVHPIEATKILIDFHADEDTLISALLHDVPEDTGHDPSELKENFGCTVAFLVDGITKLSKVHYQNNMSERQIESLRKMLVSSSKDLRIILIKLADRLHNMRTLQFVNPEKRVRIAKETLEIYIPIVNLLGIFIIKKPLEDLCFKYLLPTEYARLEGKQEKIKKKYDHDAKEFIRDISEKLKENKIKANIILKEKGLFREYKKLCAQGKTIDDMIDSVSAGVITPNVHDCYKALGVIHEAFVPMPNGFRDFISKPKINGYRALHTTVFGVNGVLTNLQIQSDEMYFEGKFGVASLFFNHKKDKNFGWSGEKHLWINKILEIGEIDKLSDQFLEDIKEDVLQDRITTFTPKGDSIDLPSGATAIDFGYSLHRYIGNHAIKAEINGEMHPVITPLKTGDVVRIITFRNSTPKLHWLSFVRTNTAKNNILSHFRRISTAKKLSGGHLILQKELDIAGMGPYRKLHFKSVKKCLMEKLGVTFDNWEKLFLALGEGRVKAVNVVKSIQAPFKENGLKDIKGISFNLKIVAGNRSGLVADIYKVLYKYATEVVYMNGVASRSLENAHFSIRVIVSDLEKIAYIVDEIEHIDNIKSVYSIPSKKLLWFYILTCITAGIWVIHPLILIEFIPFKSSHQSLSTFLIFFGFFVLFFMLIYLKKMVKKYFPFLRTKKRFLIVSLLIITFALGVSCVEFIYHKLTLSWIPAVIFVLALYTYVITSYFEDRKSHL